MKRSYHLSATHSIDIQKDKQFLNKRNSHFAVQNPFRVINFFQNFTPKINFLKRIRQKEKLRIMRQAIIL
jgi:hypothetical protein